MVMKAYASPTRNGSDDIAVSVGNSKGKSEMKLRGGNLDHRCKEVLAGRYIGGHGSDARYGTAARPRRGQEITCGTRSSGHGLTNRSEEVLKTREPGRRDRGRSTEKPRSSTPLGKMTPTERLRSFDSRKKSPMAQSHAKSLDKTRPCAASLSISSSSRTSRSISLDRSRRSNSSMKSNVVEHGSIALGSSRSIERYKSNRNRSFDFKRSNSEGFFLRGGTPDGGSMAPCAHEDGTTSSTTMVDLTSRLSCRVERPMPQSQHRSFLGEKQHGLRLFEPISKGPRFRLRTPELFAHAKLRVDMGTQPSGSDTGTLRTPPDETDEDDVSDLSLGTAEGSLFTLPRLPAATPMMGSAKVPKAASSSNIYHTAFSEKMHIDCYLQQSTVSNGSAGDRYTMFADSNDSFDEAARARLKSKSLMFADQLIPSPNSSFDQTQLVAPIVNLESGGSSPREKQRSSKSRLLLLSRKSGKTKSAVPGLSIGQSRSFVDHVEGQLEAIKFKRKVQQDGEDQRGKGSNWEGCNTNRDRRTVEPCGIFNCTPTRTSETLGSGVDREMKLAFGKLQKPSGTLVGVIKGCGDRKSAFSGNLDRAVGDAFINGLNPINSAKGSQAVSKTPHPGSPEKVSLALPPSGLASARGETRSPANAEILLPEKVHRGWFRRKNDGHFSNVSRVSVAQPYARDSINGIRLSMRNSCNKSGSLLARRMKEDYIGSNDNLHANSEYTKHIDAISCCVVKPMMSFDSALRQPGEAPEAEFAMVELGEDENTVTTHSIVVNKEQMEHHFTGQDNTGQDLDGKNNENESLVANSRNTKKPTGALPSIRHIPGKKLAKDDASLDDVELTVSFASQLRHVEQLQKPPYKVPRGAFML